MVRADGVGAFGEQLVGKCVNAAVIRPAAHEGVDVACVVGLKLTLHGERDIEGQGR